MENLLSIIIPAHDSYKDIVQVFESSIKNWKDCTYRIYWTSGEN